MKVTKQDTALCTCNIIHTDVLARLESKMINETTSFNLANFFKVLGDPTRIKILYVLSKEELCVCDIKEILSMSQSAISHQLRVLRDARLVKFRRDGKEVYYTLDDDHVKKIFEQGMEHLEHR